jgi:hypothetical protein
MEQALGYVVYWRPRLCDNQLLLSLLPGSLLPALPPLLLPISSHCRRSVAHHFDRRPCY